MRYYLDTEFFERPGHIDLISIGIVAQDGREFYAENSQFNWLQIEETARHGYGQMRETPRWLIENVFPHLGPESDRLHPEIIRDDLLEFFEGDDDPEFWGWYCDYDWVVFCWLFGRMIDLPEHFPKFCRDLRQLIDKTGLRAKDVPMDGDEHNALADAHWNAKLHDYILERL